VSLKPTLKELGKRNISSLLVEGGGKVIGSFLVEGFWDKFVVFISPLVIGGEKSKSAVVWPDLSERISAPGRKINIVRVKRSGPDFMMETECFQE